MNDEAKFLRAMQEHPDDASVRLVFADWLEERGDLRGELLRLLNTLTQSVDVPDRRKLEERLRFLVASAIRPVGPYMTNSIGMKFALIWPGTFMMGSPPDEEGRSEDETQHQVTLTKGYYLAIHPVTQGFWQAVTGDDQPWHPRKFRSNLTVEEVSWLDCQDFLRKLCDLDGRAYRLPTEAEWEYACRAGTTTPFPFGEALPKAAFPPNGWGLCDMVGDVWEWCEDWHGDYPQDDVIDPQGPKTGEGRAVRGGYFMFSDSLSDSLGRSAYRARCHPTDRIRQVGFRPILTSPDSPELHR